MLHSFIRQRIVLAGVVVVSFAFVAIHACANEPKPAEPAPRTKVSQLNQAELDEAFSKMLSGATLEGSFTTTGEGADPTKLSTEKYTLGNVRKIQGDYWLIPARIQYGEHDVTIPLTLPVRWAGDTPMIVVDNVGLPGFGTVSARVMFCADHYAGYWQHGKSGGHLFGVIRREAKGDDGSADAKAEPAASGDPAGREQKQQQDRKE